MLRIRTGLLLAVSALALLGLTGCGKPDPAVDAAHAPPPPQTAQPGAGQTQVPGGSGATQPGATVPTGDL